MPRVYILFAVTKSDPSAEAQRLKTLYGGMEDSELSALAAQADTLTEVARALLADEMRRRSMEAPPPVVAATADATPGAIPPEPVMIRRYRDLPIAQLAKSALDSAGIESFLVDENVVRLDWFYSNLVGGIKLLVRQEDAEAATKLLDESTPEKFEIEGAEEFVQPRCPKCNSMDVSLDGLSRKASYASLIIGVPVPITQTGWQCHACGHTWQEEDAEGRAASATEGPQKP